MSGAFSEDLRRHAGPAQRLSGLSAVRLLLSEYGLQALLAYRLGRWLLQARYRWWIWPLLPPGWVVYFLFSRYVWLAFDTRLELSAEIGPGLYIGHFGNIRIHHCRIGRQCSISQSVHIGPGADGVAPAIGDRVWIGAHAQIVGPYRVGNGSTISAAAVLQRDLPDHTLCLGNPARVVMRDYDNRTILGLD